MNYETTLLVLSNRAFLYGMLARGFAEEADDAFIELFSSEHSREELSLVEHELTGDIVAAYEGALACTRGTSAITRIGQEYAEIFVGPGTPKAYPWETVHLSDTKTLFKPELALIRDTYRAAGFLPARYPHVQDDFIGLEFDFLAKLADAALRAWESNDESAAEVRLSQSRAFLDDHLLRWVDSLADAIEANYPKSFYVPFSRLAALVAKRDRDTLA